MQPRDVRDHNLQTVLRAIVNSSVDPSRSEVAAATGLTKPTVAALVDQLESARLIVGGAPVAAPRAGRPSIPLRPHPDGPLGAGMEIAADHIAVLVTDLASNELAYARRFGQFTGAAARHTAKQLVELLNSTTSRQVAAMCVSVPGRLTPDQRSVLSAPNLEWRTVALLDEIEAHLALRGIPGTAMLANDAALAATSELKYRAAESSFLFIHGGTGVGGAIVLDSTLLGGVNGWAGEIGHVQVSAEGPRCRCGRTGCLEAHMGFHALRERATLPADVHIDDVIERLTSLLGRAAMLELIGLPLGRAVAAATNLLDLTHVVLSGYLAPIATELAPVISQTWSARALGVEGRGLALSPAVAEPRGTDTPGPSLRGAAAAALRPILDHPAAWIAGHC
ncbi:MAG: ROK family protein [Arachnia sp.]